MTAPGRLDVNGVSGNNAYRLACLPMSTLPLEFIRITSQRPSRIFPWIDSGTLNVDWSLRVDTLTAVMLIVVTGVSSMVHVYSVGYMAEDPGIPRFMSYLRLFTFFMLMLVTSDNLVPSFFGRGGVGPAPGLHRAR